MVNFKYFSLVKLEANVADGVHGGLRALRRLNRKSAGQSSRTTGIIMYIHFYLHQWIT